MDKMEAEEVVDIFEAYDELLNTNRIKDKLLDECYEFILNNVGVQDEYIDYEGKSALLKRLKGE
jgi:hypothetical protein